MTAWSAARVPPSSRSSEYRAECAALRRGAAMGARGRHGLSGGASRTSAGGVTRARFGGVGCGGELSGGDRYAALLLLPVLGVARTPDPNASPSPALERVGTRLRRLTAVDVMSWSWRPEESEGQADGRGVKNLLNRFGVMGGGRWGFRALAPGAGLGGEDMVERESAQSRGRAGGGLVLGTVGLLGGGIGLLWRAMKSGERDQSGEGWKTDDDDIRLEVETWPVLGTRRRATHATRSLLVVLAQSGLARSPGGARRILPPTHASAKIFVLCFHSQSCLQQSAKRMLAALLPARDSRTGAQNARATSPLQRRRRRRGRWCSPTTKKLFPEAAGASSRRSSTSKSRPRQRRTCSLSNPRPDDPRRPTPRPRMHPRRSDRRKREKPRMAASWRSSRP